MLSTFINYLQHQRRYSKHTLSAYEADLLELQAFMQPMDAGAPHQATPHIVRQWIMELSEAGKEPATINRKLATLRSFFKFLMREGLVTQNPMLRIRSASLKQRTPTFVNEQPMQQLLQSLETDTTELPGDYESLRNRLIVELFYTTGMRLAELSELKQEAINLQEAKLKVLGKRNKERLIPIHSSVLPLLKNYIKLKDRAYPQLPYFWVSNRGKALSRNAIQRIVHQALSRVSSHEKKSPHVLRHTFATHLLNNGAEINAIKEILGHSSLAATQVYTHNSIEKLKEAWAKAHPRSGKED